MINRMDSSARSRRRNALIRSVLWVAFFASMLWPMVAVWGLTFWPSMAVFTVYIVGVALPLGVTLGIFIGRRPAARGR